MVTLLHYRRIPLGILLTILGFVLVGCHSIRPESMDAKVTQAPRSTQPIQQVKFGQPREIVRSQSGNPQMFHGEETLPPPHLKRNHFGQHVPPGQTVISEPTFGVPAGPPGPHGPPPGPKHPPGPLPTELAPVAHPTYRVSPPDILFIDAQPFFPRPPYRLQLLDELIIQVAKPLPNQPIAGKYRVSPEGTINLGFSYGSVRVGGMTVDQAQKEIERHLSDILKSPQVAVALESFRAIPQVRGEHLVRPDGTISLGVYGCVFVNGLTLAQIKCVIEKHLSKDVLDPRVSVDVFAYNSKKYYVIVDGGGFGQLVKAFPYTGYETVLDAIERIGGLPAVSSKRKIWVARPTPGNACCTQVLPVDWNAITQAGSTPTNYQLFPGDRIYVRADALIEADNWLAKAFAPVERILGITLLGSSVVNSFRNNGFNNGTGFVVTAN